MICIYIYIYTRVHSYLHLLTVCVCVSELKTPSRNPQRMDSQAVTIQGQDPLNYVSLSCPLPRVLACKEPFQIQWCCVCSWHLTFYNSYKWVALTIRILRRDCWSWEKITGFSSQRHLITGQNKPGINLIVSYSFCLTIWSRLSWSQMDQSVLNDPKTVM